jgi:hypothetical protein
MEQKAAGVGRYSFRRTLRKDTADARKSLRQPRISHFRYSVKLLFQT